MSVESSFDIPKMDCPSEEQMIRMALEPLAEVRSLRFDLNQRTLLVRHEGPPQVILSRLEPLGFGARLSSSVELEEAATTETSAPDERRVLGQLLAINAAMFIAELAFGIWAESTGLIADSLDMLADAMVYSLSLFAVGRAAASQRRAARASGWLQMALAVAALGEVARRAVVGSEPAEVVMIGVASVALVANLGCVALLARHRDGGVHLKASWIFSTNDVLANLGVVAAGALVLATGSAIPDLIIGGVVGLLVLSGAVRILRL
ncbi:MAG: cation transporter [Alphaproteobacteria bacterium]|nr:cation transporter [Alphaproteobacteria bacterium]MCB9791951.1 cation transporter [Alphaproteobacteria bacterium]